MRWFGDCINGLTVIRDGFLGIGGSAAKTDRGNQLAATQSQWSVFNQGLGLSGQENTTGQEQQKTGQGNLNDATSYWKNLLTAGRTQTAANAAPAINAAEAGADAQRNQQAQFGSGRSGGTAAGNQQAETQKNSTVDNIINENLVGGRKEAASGLAAAGATDLSAGSDSMSKALAALGISGTAGNNILNNSFDSYKYTNEQSKQQGQAAGQAAAQLFSFFL